ncbi:hypothetical protein JCM6882_002168 [Rhodosporidiobolus microsporus]
MAPPARLEAVSDTSKTPTHAHPTAPTANDGQRTRQREEDPAEERQGQILLSGGLAAGTSPLLPFPVETLLAILQDPSLTRADRAACCRVSQAFLPVALRALYDTIQVELYNYSDGHEYLVLDQTHRAVFKHLTRVPTDAARLREFVAVVHPDRGWPNVESSDPDAVTARYESSDTDSELGSDDCECEFRDPVLKRDDFDLGFHLHEVLCVTSNLTKLEVRGEPCKNFFIDFSNLHLSRLTHLTLPSFPLHLVHRLPSLSHVRVKDPVLDAETPTLPSSSHLRHLTVTSARYSNSQSLGPVLASFAGLKALALEYEPLHGRILEVHTIARPNLRPLAAIELESFSLTLLGTIFNNTPPAEPLRFPPQVATLELRAGPELNWRWISSNPLSLLSRPFLADLPSSTSHLRIDPRPFDIPALCTFISSPSTLPNLASVTVLSLSPSSIHVDLSNSKRSNEDAAPRARSGRPFDVKAEILRACRERGVVVKVEELEEEEEDKDSDDGFSS